MIAFAPAAALFVSLELATILSNARPCIAFLQVNVSPYNANVGFSIVDKSVLPKSLNLAIILPLFVSFDNADALSKAIIPQRDCLISTYLLEYQDA